jgi:hypothetical protein
MTYKKLFRFTLMICCGIVLLTNLAAGVSSAQSQNIKWAARLYPSEPGYIEVYIDARGMTIREEIGSVSLDIAFFDQANRRLKDEYLTLPAGRLTQFRREAYRSILKHPSAGTREAVGTVMSIFGPYPGSEESAAPLLGTARASAWSDEMSAVRQIDPSPPSSRNVPSIPMWPIDTARSYFITSVYSGKVMDARDSSQDDWVPIVQTTKHEGSSQQWRFEPLNGSDGGYYHIRSVRSDKCLDVKLGDTADGAAIIQYPCGDGDGQKWALFASPGHAVQIVAKHSGKAVDINGGVVADADLIQVTRHSGKNQQWTMDAGEASAAVLSLELLVHIQNVGDRSVGANEFAGTRGESRALNGFQVRFNPPVEGLGLQYLARVHDQRDFMARDGEYAGVRDESLPLEEFAIELTGPNAARYDVYYMAHIQDIGDTPFSKNGEFCGSRGQGKRIEGILVRVVPK